MAVHDDSTPMTPISVVSRISSALKPSTPRKYSAPIEGIQARRSTNCQPASCVSYQNHSGSETRKPAPAVALAIHRIRSSWRRSVSSRSTTPTSGVKRISDSKGNPAALLMVLNAGQRPTRNQVTNANTPTSVANA